MCVYSAWGVVLLYIITYSMLGLIERYFNIILYYFKIGQELMCEKMILGPEGLNFNL